MSETKPDNVLFMKAQHPIFTGELRDKLIRTLPEPTAEQTVDNVEHIICTHLIQKGKDFGTKIGTIIGTKLSKVLGLSDDK